MHTCIYTYFDVVVWQTLATESKREKNLYLTLCSFNTLILAKKNWAYGALAHLSNHYCIKAK